MNQELKNNTPRLTEFYRFCIAFPPLEEVREGSQLALWEIKNILHYLR